jgi:hypothetical protein
MRVIADVKCYHCGHVSGQLEGDRSAPLAAAMFRPRPGYQGPAPRPGPALRCERCQGPVYLEDMRPLAPLAALAPSPNHCGRRRRRLARMNVA